MAVAGGLQVACSPTVAGAGVQMAGSTVPVDFEQSKSVTDMKK